MAVVGATTLGANFTAPVTKKIKVAVKLAVVGATTLGANITAPNAKMACRGTVSSLAHRYGKPHNFL